MSCAIERKSYTIFQVEFLLIFKTPGKIINGFLQFSDPFLRHGGKGHGIPQHRPKKYFCGMCGDNFTLETLSNYLRYSPDMIDMSMGKKEVIHL